MIKIKKTEDHLGPGVFTMTCDCNDTPFLVNSRPEVPVHYNPTSKMVRCPWGCGVEVSLTVILENDERDKNIDHFLHKVHEAWSPDNINEEKK